MSEHTTCKRCGKPMLWGQTTPGGKAIPLDPEPDPTGNCERVGTTRAGAPIVLVLTKGQQEAQSLFTAERFMPHAATCTPNAGGDEVKLPANPTATQAFAAERARSNSAKQRQAVLAAIAARPSTDHELAAQLGLDGNSIRPRRKELQERGLIEPSGATRPSPSGRPCIVWRVSSS